MIKECVERQNFSQRLHHMPRTEHSFLLLLLLFCCFVSVSCAAGETAAIDDAGAGFAFDS
jgi:hypothetical protein